MITAFPLNVLGDADYFFSVIAIILVALGLVYGVVRAINWKARTKEVVQDVEQLTKEAGQDAEKLYENMVDDWKRDQDKRDKGE